MRVILRPSMLTLAAALIFAGCNGDDGQAAPADESPTTTPATVPTSPAPEPTRTPSPSPTPSGPVVPAGTEVVAIGLDIPWDLEFLDDGSALVTERSTARVLRVGQDGELDEVGEVPGLDPGGEGGLMGIAQHEDWLYAMFTAAEDNRVIRMEFDGDSLGDAEVVFDGLPKADFHNGGRIVFGPDGMLYIGTGDATNSPLAQDRDSVAGSILRLTPGGDVPGDNPFDGSPVWSYGHRNVQGLAFDDEGRLWASEFGNDLRDELNLIEPGSNYGWPEVEGIAGDDRFVDPVAEWPTDDASPSGIAYVRDTIFLAGLKGQRLWQVPIVDRDAGEVGEPQDFLVGEFGRLRHAELAPDGTLWLLTNNTDSRNPDGPGPDDDRIIRVSLE